jgi:hypothetical protein
MHDFAHNFPLDECTVSTLAQRNSSPPVLANNEIALKRHEYIRSEVLSVTGWCHKLFMDPLIHIHVTYSESCVCLECFTALNQSYSSRTRRGAPSSKSFIRQSGCMATAAKHDVLMLNDTCRPTPTAVGERAIGIPTSIQEPYLRPNSNNIKRVMQCRMWALFFHNLLSPSIYYTTRCSIRLKHLFTSNDMNSSWHTCSQQTTADTHPVKTQPSCTVTKEGLLQQILILYLV